MNHDNLRRLTVDNKASWYPARIMTGCHTYSFILCSLYVRQASSCSICFKGLDLPLQTRSQRPAFAYVEQYWQNESWLSVPAPVWSLLPLLMPRPWFVWIPRIWTGPLLLPLSDSFRYCWMALAWCCWWWFCCCRSWFPCRNQQLFSPAFQWVVAVLLHWLPEDRHRQ